MKNAIILGVAALALIVGAMEARAVTLEVGSGSGAAGSTVAVQTTLRSMGSDVKGVINELTVGAATPVSSCVVNPIFQSTGTVSLLPESCQAGVDCLTARAVLARFSNDSIPDGTELYSCEFKITEGATGDYPITCSNPEASDPNGGALAVTCSNGTISVGGAAFCTGDCNGDNEVFGNEVTVAINIVAGNADLATCENADANGDGEVFGNEVTIAINNVANGCPE